MRIFPLGESALTIEFGNEISAELNDRAVSLSQMLRDDPFPGMIESVPAYSSVTVFFDLIAVRAACPEFATAFEAVSYIAARTAEGLTAGHNTEPRRLTIPVVFDDNASLDLDRICEFAGLGRSDTIELFLSRTYRVFMLGFLPGFAYMGEVDERIAAPRLSSPRTIVPRGSVGIAGLQTGIYPIGSPGGWNIIGRTDVRLLDPAANEPCLLRPGDQVRFESAS